MEATDIRVITGRHSRRETIYTGITELQCEEGGPYEEGGSVWTRLWLKRDGKYVGTETGDPLVIEAA